MKKLGKSGILLAVFVLAPLLAKAGNAEFVSVVTDRSDLQYTEGDQAHISVTKRISPTDPNFALTFESYFPDGGHPIAMAKIGDIYSFITPRLAVGQQNFIVKAYLQFLAKPPLRDGARTLVESKDVVLNVSHDTTPPVLSISTPNEGQTIQGMSLHVSGYSNEALSQVSVHLDNEASVPATLSGNLVGFSADLIPSHRGSAVLYVDAKDLAGNLTTKQISVSFDYNQAPTAQLSLTSLNPTTAPAMALFDASSSSDPDGDAIQYSYDFGDGTPIQSGISTATHQYEAAGSYTAQVTVTDAGGLSSTKSVSVSVAAVVLPPNPQDIAPPIATEPNSPPPTMVDKVGFIYSGPNPVQTGVNQNAMDPELVSVFRGHISDDNNNALSGVKVTIAGESVFGQTLTRDDGNFDIAVNAGGDVTIQMEKTGYTNVQRTISTDGQNYYAVPDVVMASLDQKVTTVSLSKPEAQVVQASTVTDNDGERTASLILPSQTTAQIEMPDGSLRPVDNLSIRATEVTVGDNGPKKMPGQLPPKTAYTYAVDLTSDEALAMGGKGVKFNQAVPFYVDNFLNFPVGTAVPVGYFNPDTHVWEPQKDGIVIKITDIQNGKAVVSVSPGTNATADDLEYFKITDEELTKLAATYPVGKELWRAQTTHFSTIDLNFMGNSTVSPKLPSVADKVNSDCYCTTMPGSLINVERRTLNEKINLVGVPFPIYYSTANVPGMKAENSLTAHLYDDIPSNLKKVEVDIAVGGQKIHKESTDLPALKDVSIDWDGKDAYGRNLPGVVVPVSVKYTFHYDSNYMYLPFDKDLDSTWDTYTLGMLSYSSTRQELTYSLSQESGFYRAASTEGLAGQKSMGGWTLPIYHQLDVLTGTVVFGTGSISNAINKPAFVSTILGKAGTGFSGDGGPATDAKFGSIDSYSVQDDGSVLVVDSANNRIRRIDKNGIINTIIGNGIAGYNGDDISALQAQINFPSSVTQDRNGNIYFLDTNNNRVRKVTTDGIIHTIAGTGAPGYSGDNGDALQAKLKKPRSMHFIKGYLYFSDAGNDVIRRIGPTGKIETIAGNGTAGYSGDSGMAIEAQLNNPRISFVTPNGELYISDIGNNVIRKVDRNGIITTIAGNGTAGYLGDNGPALQAELNGPTNISLMDDGSYYIADKNNNRIRYVDSNGIISTKIGTGLLGPSEDGLPGNLTNIAGANVVNARKGNKIIFIESGSNKVRVLSPSGIGFDENTNTYSVASQDGSEVYYFDANGLHIRTASGKTGATIYQFEHDSSGRLIGVKDTFGNETVFGWSGDKIVSISAPYGQITALNYNGDGNLSDVISPMGNSYHMEYASAEGLLTSFKKPTGETSAFAYDAKGLLVTDSNALSFSQQLFGNLEDTINGITHISAEGLRTNITHRSDYAGEVTQTKTYPSGRVEYLYRMNSNSTDEKGDSSGYSHYNIYNNDSRLDGATYLHIGHTENGASIQEKKIERTYPVLSDAYTYVQKDIITEVTGSQVTKTFNSQTKILSEESGLGRTKSTAFDGNENVIQKKIGSFYPENYQYDSHGRLFQIQQGDRTTTFNYNSQGLLEQIIDPLGQYLQFSYDSDGRNISQTMPDGRTHTFSYDENSNLIGITPSGRALHKFVFSIIDLVTQYVPALNMGNTVSYSYNKDGVLTKDTRADGKIVNYNFNSTTGLLDSLSTDERTVNYSYTEGNLSSAVSPEMNEQIIWSGHIPVQIFSADASFGFSYQKNLELYGSRIGSLIINGTTIPMTYDGDDLTNSVGNLQIARSSDSGIITGTTLGSLEENIGYSDFAEIANHSYAFNGSNIYSEQYTRDKLGRLTTKVVQTPNGTSTINYEYNSSGRLYRVTTDGTTVNQYTYDDQGNRLSVTYGSTSVSGTYDGQDRILTYGVNQYSLSPDGEVTSILDTSNGQTKTFSYDSQGQLIGAKLKDNRQVGYILSPLGQRYSKSIDGVLKAYFSYDDQGRLVSDGDQNGTRNIYVYAGQGHSPDYIIRGGEEYKLIKDQVGSVVLVVNVSTGAVVQQIQYDEFGRVLSDSNPGFQFIGFAGGIYDADTKLVKFGARDYDSETGRWMSKDPIRFNSGDTNLFGYVQNDSVNFVDPTGLAPGFNTREGAGSGSARDEFSDRTNIGDDQARRNNSQAAMVGAGIMCTGAAAVATPYATAACLANPVFCTEATVAAVSGVVGSLSNSSDVPDPTKPPSSHLIEWLAGQITGAIFGQ